MESRDRVARAPWYEMLGFGVLIAMYWLVELTPSPEFLGFENVRAWDQAESVLLTTLTLLVAVPAVGRTRRLAAKVFYLEGILRSRDHGSDATVGVIARLADGNLAVQWRFALETAVQSIVHPAASGTIVAGRAYRAADGRPREEYEVQRQDGSRFVASGEELRYLPLCEGRPMHYVGVREDPGGPVTLLYRCPDCGGTSQLLL